jgi:hypothetical protein
MAHAGTNTDLDERTAALRKIYLQSLRLDRVITRLARRYGIKLTEAK